MLASFAGAAVTFVDGRVPVGAGLGVRGGEAEVAERGVDLLERDLRVADDAERAVLQRVVAVDVDRDEPAVGVGEDRPRAGGEVLEAGADADHEVGRRAGRVAAGRAGDAGRAEVHRVLPGGRALAGLGLEDRDVAARGEVGEQVLGAGVEHAAAGDDHRRLRGADRRDDLGHLDRVGLGAADAPDPRLEEALRVVVGLGLHVLAEGEADRAAVGRVGHRAQRAGQRGQEVLGPGDAVEVAGDRPEAVVGRDRAVVEVLDLLQHRVGAAVGEDVAADEEHRQAVDVGERRRGDHVGRARADRGGDRMGAAPALGLGVGDRRMRHRLLVLAAPGRERVADAVQRLADAGDVAVAEDRPDALDEALAVLGHLHAQPAHHRLRRRQPDRSRSSVPLPSCPSDSCHCLPRGRPRLVPDRAEPGIAPRHLRDRRVVVRSRPSSSPARRRRRSSGRPRSP